MTTIIYSGLDSVLRPNSCKFWPDLSFTLTVWSSNKESILSITLLCFKAQLPSASTYMTSQLFGWMPAFTVWKFHLLHKCPHSRQPNLLWRSIRLDAPNSTSCESVQRRCRGAQFAYIFSTLWIQAHAANWAQRNAHVPDTCAQSIVFRLNIIQYCSWLNNWGCILELFC